MEKNIKLQKGFAPIFIILIIILGIGGISGTYGAVEYHKTSKLVKEAEQLAKEEKYDEANGKLELAQNSWLTKNLGIKKQEITDEVEKNKKLLEDKSEYTQGIEEFNKGNWEKATELLSKVSEISPYYQASQDKISEIEDKIAEEKLIETPKEIRQPPGPEIICQNECFPAGSKKCSNNGYQVCGNYDEDDCLEWSSTTNCPSNAICQNGNCVQQKCSDGTLYGQCSINKPSYCENGNLINKCYTCGCPDNQSCQSNGFCCKNECSQLGSKACFDNNSYQVCGNDEKGCLKWGPLASCLEKSCRMGNCVAVSFPSPEVKYWAIILTAIIGEDTTLDINRNTNLKNILLKNGWQENHIKTLTGKDATYENLMSALDWLKNNSSSNDIILFVLNAHGAEGVMQLEDNKFLYYSELGEKLNNLKYKGLLIIIQSCFGYTAIPYLKKENRVIIWPTGNPSLIWQTLSGLGDFRGNNDDWVSAEEIYNMNQLYDIAFPGENKTLIQDDFPGELNIVFLNGYWRDLDQYNPQNTTIYGYYGTGVGAIKEKVDTWLVQSFTPNLPILTKVALSIIRKGNPGPLTLSIRENLSGPDLTSITLPDSLFLKDINQLTDFDFQDIEVTPGKTYYIVIKAPQAALKTEGDFNYYAIEESRSLKESDDYYSKGELSIFNDPFPPYGFFHTDLSFFTFGKIK